MLNFLKQWTSRIGRPFGKTAGQSPRFQGFTDWHSHILPGVDDGSANMDESLKILSGFEALGFSEVWLTPHIMEDFPNTTEELRSRFAELQEAYNGPVKLHLASENMLDTLFAERLASRDFLPIGSAGNLLLVETSYFRPPTGLDEMLFSIHSAGLTPLLAHPERYVYMELKDYDRLHSQGVKFQLNYMSLLGHYGPDARAKARRLLQNGYYTHAGTDIHRSGHIPILNRIPLKNLPPLEGTVVRP